MNTNIAEGKLDQLTGKLKQAAGEAVGNEKLANSGAADQVKGAAKEAWGNATDAADTVSADAKARAEAKHAEASKDASDKAHDLREKIVSTAQHMKDAISAKAETIREEHK